MAKTTINIVVNDQELLLENRPTIASGGQDENLIKFSFSSEWDGFDKTAIFYNTKEEVFEVKLNEDDEAIIPFFVTVKPCILYIAVYGENGNTVRTSEDINYRVVQGATTNNTDPLAPVKEEAYNEGYEKGYSDGNAYMKSFVEYCEDRETKAGFDTKGLRGLWALGSAKHPVVLPYMDTRESSTSLNYTQGVTFGYYVKEIGFDISSIKSFSKAFFHPSKSIIEKMIITGFKTLKADTQFSELFGNLYLLSEVYTDDIAISPAHTAGVNYDRLFYGCEGLETIGGFNRDTKQYDDTLGFIDFTGCTNTTSMFTKCYRLQNVKFKPNTLDINLTMSDSAMLTKESVLSVINTLNGFTATNNPTIYLAANIKNSMSHDWFCEDNDGDDIFNICVPAYEGAMTFSEAVLAKGWNLQ